MIQNAEDAGARTVNILTDARWLHKDLDEETLKKHRHLKFLRAPALCVYNDAEFTTEDWKGIRMLHASVKEKDPLKVGRFGLGFKSVFHLTDCLTIISGGRIMYMDPSLDERRCCRSKTLAKLKGKEMDSVSHCIDSVLGVTQKTFQPDVGHFPGTMFWFPLREEASNLSKNVYTQDKVHDLFNAFKAEARSMLLFLKNIERVEIFAREETHDPEKLFTVEVAMSCLEAVRTERRRFIKGLQESVSNLPAQCLECVTEMTIATSDHQAHSHDSRCWLVVNYHPGQGEVSSELAELCTDPDLAYQPHVGVAIPREQLREFQSHIFCFLPLPLHASSPTGLPVHVNGYFALTQNRRDLKWPTQDQLDNKAHLEAPERWNRLMVKELVPRAYVRLLQRLKQLHGQNSDVFYAAWPDVKHVNDKGRPVVEPLFRTMATKPSFYTQARGGDWISLNQAVLPDFPADTSPDVRRAVLKVYTENNRNLIKLPDHVERGLKELELLQSVTTVSPQGTSQLLPNCLPRLTFSEKLHVLQYFCCQSDAAKLLQNQHLLPLANGDFGVFGAAVTYWCEENLLRLFPGLERQFVSCDTGLPPVVREKLRQLAESSLLYLRRLQENDPQVVRLLEESLQERFGRHQPSLSPQDPWIQKVWQFLSSTHPWCRDLGQMSHLTLLPCQTDSSLTLFPLNGLYVCRTARGFTQLNPALASSLTRLIITVLPQLPSYVTHPGVVGGLVQYPSAEGVLEVLRKLTRDDSLRNAAVLNFNSCASSEEVNALVSFLADIKSRLGGEVDLFRELNLFNSTDGRRVSVTNVNEIVPGCSLPIEPPWSLLSCTSTSERAALKLGARKKTLKEVVNDILGLIYKYSQPDVINFMKFFISRDDLLSDSSLTSGARQVSFLSTRSGQLKAAEDLYDPSCQVLVDMFHAEDRFPCGEFATPNMLKRLRKLGLMTEKTVESGDLLEAARRIESFWKQSNMSVAEKKAEGLWKFLTNHGSILQGNDLSTLSQIRCLPCLQPHSKPRDYPSSLPIMSEPKITRPAEMSQIKHIRLCGSAMPIARPNLPETLASKLQVDSQLTPHHVLQHLRMVVHSYNAGQVAQYRLILADIFQCLNASRADGTVWQTLQQTECVLVESEDSFVRPDRFWVQTAKTDIDLKPYRFPLPKDMMPAKDLIRQCGSSLAQDEGVLQEVLGEIRDKHEHATHSREVFRNDLQLVKRILDELKSKECAAKGTVLLPIDHHEDSVLRFKPAGECTFGGQVGALADDEEAIFFIHPEILPGTAKALGALDIRQRALTGAEGLDYGYGQQEKLTTRLHNLLKDSYTDGFSVPKELIQNADDAGATEVRLLLDERENKDARSNLISDNMASLQGPAIWAFNDATFSDADFENIVKLGAGTKQEDASKVGRFGLGFNAVYNLTDVPSFISKHTLAIFDPHAKYLPEGAGLKLDFGRPINQSLLSRMPNQFKPFQGVFDCRLEKDEGVFYSGTLFRFPLRTEQQAEKSEIKAESYSQTKRREFLKMLLDRAGSLLMFTQNVRKVQVFHLPPNCSDPRQARCLLTVTRTSLGTNLLSGPSSFRGSIMQYCTANWRKNTDIKILEQVSIVLDVTDDATAVCGVDKVHVETHWTLAWATGTDESAKAVQRHNMVGFVPLATVAVLLTENTIQPLSKSPFGFYTSGHLFCFMPLPKEMVDVSLPVHVNGTFDLTSSRRGLQVRTEDDMSSGADSNSALFGDAVCRAYLLLLEKVAEEASGDQNQRYFELWPDSGKDSLDKNFYRRLVLDGNKVFPVPGRDISVSFSDARILDPDFKESESGQHAWDAASHFWDGEEGLVDVPAHVCRLIQRKGQEDDFRAIVITKQEFYERIFFPHISSDYWQHACEVRDKLVHHALIENDNNILSLVRTHACIPCENCEELKRPMELIHPSRKAAMLYKSSEGRFPKGSGKKSGENRQDVNFQSYHSLYSLEKMGMTADDLPWNMLEERARSVGVLCKENSEAAQERVCRLLEYLSSLKTDCSDYRFSTYRPEECQSLSQIRFLPVLSKPDDWPFPWGSDETQDVLAAPHELFSDHLRDLVGCKVKLLDTATFSDYGPKKRVLKSLGVQFDNDYKNQNLLDLVTQQLLTVMEHHEQDRSEDRDSVQRVCDAVCSFLNNCFLQPAESLANTFPIRLCDVNMIWMGGQFVPTSRLAFSNVNDCRPYLFQLESSLRRYEALFQALGVKEKFQTEDALMVFREIQQKHGDNKLDDSSIKLVSRVALLLCEAMGSDDRALDGEQVVLPDRDGFLLPTYQLCLDDCSWLEESDTMKFVHKTISAEAAFRLGVKTKQGKHLEDVMTPLPFGQIEKLTARIRRLLEGYTFNSCLFKELLQNADDAGATEVKFILDMRTLGKEKVPYEWSEHLQGPALCVYSNKSFTSKDMEGIQNLGQGSKEEDLLKTGQFGVGFNAVYDITDVPSFWTRENDEEEVICVFDPNRLYIKKTPKPGGKFRNSRLIRQYPDMFDGYLEDYIDMSAPGTVFRFPLRTQEMAEQSQIKDKVTSVDSITSRLREFEAEMGRCLLFLNNLQSIEVSSISDKNEISMNFKVERQIHESCLVSLDDFREKLQSVSRAIDTQGTELKDIPDFEAVVQMTIIDSAGHEEQWLTVNRIGFDNKTQLSMQLSEEWKEEHFRLLPRGGVAVLTAQKTNRNEQFASSGSGKKDYCAFCILPLPVLTRLPLHVNGLFVLAHEARAEIWLKNDDAKTNWNTAIALEIIVPAYVTAVQKVKEIWFQEKSEKSKVEARFTEYHHLFPDLETAPSDFWKMLVRGFYQLIVKRECPMFPVLSTDGSSLEWVPAMKRVGFGGYFSDVVTFYSSLPSRPQPDSNPAPYRDTAGISCQVSTYCTEWPQMEARKLEVLLKQLNMKVLDAPYRVFKTFQNSGVQDVQEVTPSTVLHFLRSAGSVDGCNINGLPQDIKETPFETPENVKMIVLFVKNSADFPESVEGLPLSLRQSGKLYFFHRLRESDKPIVSEFCKLLPESADAFLHEEIRESFASVCDKLQAMLREFDIHTFALLLPKTLKEAVYGQGQQCSFPISSLPSPEWIREVWTFIETCLKPLETEAKNSPGFRRRVGETLKCLAEWSLIPVKKKAENEEQMHLFPVKNAHHVVFLSSEQDQVNCQLWEILKGLPLAFLEVSCLPSANEAITNTVASISHPRALLSALASCSDHFAVPGANACIILQYFGNSLPALQESGSDDTELQQELKDLPLYTSISGSPVSISSHVSCLSMQRDIPHNGLQDWSQKRREPVVLVLAESVPETLRNFLGFVSVSAIQFYYKYLLPTLDCLPRGDILRHIEVIKTIVLHPNTLDENLEALTLQLKRTAFLEKNGCLRMAQDFMSPHEPVFEAMCEDDSFPPPPYLLPEWEEFMVVAGMVSEISDSLFVEFAHSLEREGHSGLTKALKCKSDTLVRHLFDRNDVVTSGLLQDVRDVRFLRPSEWASTNEGQLLSLIVQPLDHDKFVSFSETCLEEHVHLVWSNSSILHQNASPAHLSNQNKNRVAIMNTLGYGIKEAPQHQVVAHVQNLCLSLGGEGAETIFTQLERRNALRLLDSVFTKVYDYLSRFGARQVFLLKDLPIIFDIDRKVMFRPECVVIDLRDSERIKGHIERAPSVYGRYFKLFMTLGVTQRVTADHYAKVLLRLKSSVTREQLIVSERKVVKTAIIGLFSCLKCKEEERKRLTISALYLPAENLQLMRSTELVFVDDENIKARCDKISVNMHYFIGFRKLEISSPRPEDEVRQLPQCHQMVWLSQAVKEIVADDMKLTAIDGEYSRMLTERLRNRGCVACMIRLAYHQHVKETVRGEASFSEQEVLDGLTRISVKEIAGLRTFLEWYIMVEGSEREVPVFVEKRVAEHRECTVYVNSTLYREHDARMFIHNLAVAVQYVLDLDSIAIFVELSLEDKERASFLMTAYGIEHYDALQTSDWSIFSPAGTFVPLAEQRYLDNNFYDFEEDDIVGFEVFDPELSTDESGETDPVFIYVRVLREEKEPNQENIPLLLKRYRIHLGYEKGEAVVSVTQLYKFIRKGQHGDSQALDTCEGDTAAQQQENVPQDLAVVLRNIRAKLKEAWRLPNDADRMRVVKRLLLGWHPDRNMGNTDYEQFCTRVFQSIQCYLNLLKEGKALPENEDEVDSSLSSQAPYSAFLEHMYKRGQSYYQPSSGHSGSGYRRGGFRSTRNPQPREGRRWFRQAEADLAAAQAAKGSCDRGYNWICFKCQQACEKALKSIVYQTDAGSSLLWEHDLRLLAMLVNDPSLIQLAEKLEGRLGNHMRVRYPDVMAYPKIPADVYTSADADFACDVTDQVLERVRGLLE